jgi:hypothetical protein
MADGVCDIGEDREPRNWIITRLSPPITTEVCDEHLAPGLVYLLAADLGVDGNEFYDGVQKLVKRLADKADKQLEAAQAAEAEAAQAAQAESAQDGPPADDSDVEIVYQTFAEFQENPGGAA